jgi:hypothetical protein
MALRNLEQASTNPFDDPPFDDAPASADVDHEGASSGGRQRRHVLIPSALVSVQLSLADGQTMDMQADLINLSEGGCCLVLPRRLELPPAAVGVLTRTAERGQADERRPFVVRWAQALGEMMQIGVQYSDG